jgi:uncharacterized membrane protein YfcA
MQPLLGVPFSLLVYAFAAFLLAGFVKGFIGLGLPTIATGILTLVMAPGQAAGLLVVPNFSTNVWQALAGKRLPALLRRFWPMLVGICVGSLPGAGFLAHDTSGRATVALGIMLILYAVMSLTTPRISVPPTAEWWLAPLVGAVTGFIAVMTGVFVIPLVPYLQSLGLKRDELIQALGLSSPRQLRLASRWRGRARCRSPSSAARWWRSRRQASASPPGNGAGSASAPRCSCASSRSGSC